MGNPVADVLCQDVTFHLHTIERNARFTPCLVGGHDLTPTRCGMRVRGSNVHGVGARSSRTSPPDGRWHLARQAFR